MKNQEIWWDIIKPWYPNLCLYKVNTETAKDIKEKYANPGVVHYKFYKGPELQGELPYYFDWEG